MTLTVLGRALLSTVPDPPPEALVVVSVLLVTATTFEEAGTVLVLPPPTMLFEVSGTLFVVPTTTFVETLLVGVLPVVVTAEIDPLPAASQLARPLKRVKAIPRSVLPSSPTWLAGTSRRTHRPLAGSDPIYRRLADPELPYTMLFSPQYARCSQVPSFHCNITSLGRFAGSR